MFLSSFFPNNVITTFTNTRVETFLIVFIHDSTRAFRSNVQTFAQPAKTFFKAGPCFSSPLYMQLTRVKYTYTYKVKLENKTIRIKKEDKKQRRNQIKPKDGKIPLEKRHFNVFTTAHTKYLATFDEKYIYYFLSQITSVVILTILASFTPFHPLR